MGVSTSIRFIRRTSFQPDEQHVNFTKLDNDILDTITSSEACEICPSIARVYLRLLRAPSRYWEREGVLYFSGEQVESGYRTAWQQLIYITGVGNSTLSKTVHFLHDAGVIGYSAKAAGAGIRIFFNHALASIKKRQHKNLRLVTTPIECLVNPETRATFSGVYLQEVQDNNIRTDVRSQQLYSSPPPFRPPTRPPAEKPSHPLPSSAMAGIAIQPKSSTTQLQILSELRTDEQYQDMRDWLNNKAIPKATRIAIKESLDWLKAQGFISKQNRHLSEKRDHNKSSFTPISDKPCGQIVDKHAKKILQTLTPQQKQRWAKSLRDEITIHTGLHQLGYWDDKTWLETIQATMLQRLKAALGTINHCSQRPIPQLLTEEELQELSHAYSLFSNIFEKDLFEIIRGDLASGKLTSSVAHELIDYCRREQTALTFARDQ